MEKCETAETPASRAIRLLGLIDVAHACRLTTDAVRKWPRSKGGVIPAQHQGSVLRLAREKSIPFGPSDVVSDPSNFDRETP